MKIIFNFCSRSRPTKFFACLDNIRSISTLKSYLIVAKIDEDDTTMNCDWVKMLLKLYPEVICEWGISNNKVHAINRDLSKHVDGFDIIINMSDDLVFLEKGFDDIICKEFKKHLPNGGVLHLPDNFAGSKTMTHTIIGVPFYKQLGYMYHPDFISVYCDNHLTELSRSLGKYAFVNKKIFEHMHPHAKLAAWDDQYRATESKENYAKDKETYLRLKANNYGL